MKNRCGPEIEPWGTPHVTVFCCTTRHFQAGTGRRYNVKRWLEIGSNFVNVRDVNVIPTSIYVNVGSTLATKRTMLAYLT